MAIAERERGGGGEVCTGCVMCTVTLVCGIGIHELDSTHLYCPQKKLSHKVNELRILFWLIF